MPEVYYSIITPERGNRKPENLFSVCPEFLSYLAKAPG
jgi:hypothetical protein